MYFDWKKGRKFIMKYAWLYAVAVNPQMTDKQLIIFIFKSI